jgi:hypothetical protein
MSFPIVLAHGAAGPYDELIFIAIVVGFLIMMGIAWVRSYNRGLITLQAETPETDLPETPPTDTDSPEYVPLD